MKPRSSSSSLRRCASLAGALVSPWLFAIGVARAEVPAPPPAAPATTYEPPEFLREPPRLPERMDAATAKKLRLHDAIQIAVENNLSILLRREQLTGARASVGMSRGRFVEPTVIGGMTHTDAISPPSNVQEGAPGQLLNVRSEAWNVGLSQRVRTGTTFGLELSNNRAMSSLGNALNPVLYRSAFNFKLTQPLLKGFAFDLDVPYVDVLRAELGSERARQDVLAQMIATVRDTELAYWDVLLALKVYQVQRSSLALAEEQLRLTRRQIDAGILPPSDLIAAEGTLAQRGLGLVQAEADIEQAGDQLRRVLNLPRSTWTQPILPLDTPRFDDTPIAFDGALAKALANRPEWKQRQIDIDKAALDAKVAATERLPQLDASFTYGVLGQQTTSFRSVFDQLTSADAPVWTAGLNLTWTPFNVAADAQLASRRAAERAARTSQDQQLVDLQIELRAAIRNLETALRSVRAAGTFRTLAERSLDAEQRKFLNGTSSNFFITQRQNDVLTAQLAELSALIRHQKAMTTLNAATGVLLDDRRIRIDVRGR